MNISVTREPGRKYFSERTEEDHLEHHGVLGQKWGVRRYQNADGTLTAEGRRRVYAQGADGGYESLGNRHARSIEGARYSRDLKKNQKKLDKAYGKGDEKKIAKYSENEKILKTNRDIMLKDLSPEEIKMGEDYLMTMRNVTIGAMLGGVVGGTAAGLGTRIYNNASETEKKVYEQEAERYKKYYGTETKKNTDGADADAAARKAAKAAELDQGDNWKMYRDAQAGDKRAQEVVKKWESNKEKLEIAKRTNQYDMNFLEAIQNSKILADHDEKAIQKEYKKYLDDPQDYFENQADKLKPDI